MRLPGRILAYVAPALLFLLAVLGLANRPLQEPKSSPSASPNATPSPTPRASPSPTPLPGAPNFHQWGSITVFNGLPSDSVRAIAQTPDGVMWFGTDNGLARFDGRRVQRFTPSGENTERVLALKAGTNGELWVGTAAGAFVFADGNFMLVEATQNAGITAILLEDDAFLGTDSGLVMRVSRDPLSATPMFPQPIRGEDGAPLSIGCLVRNDSKLLACTSGKGVVEVNEGAFDELNTSPRPLFVRSLVNSDAQLWFGTDAAKGASGVHTGQSNSKVSRIPAPTADVFALEANDEGVWAGTERYGLFQFTGSKLKKNHTFENTSGGLRSNTIYTLFTDREGVLWIGTNRGVSRFDQSGALQETVSDIPNSNFVRTLHLAAVYGEFVYAGSNRGLFLRGPEYKWNEVSGFRNKCVYAIRERNTSSLLVGTSNGLYSVTGARLLDGDVRSLDRFKSREYAAVFGRGVFEVTGDRTQLVFSDQTVTAIAEGSDRLWIGTLNNGLLSFDGRNTRSELAPDVLKSGTIWKINETSDNGNVWIAGQHGVFLIRNGNVEQISSVEDVRDIWVLPNELWAATTTHGLVHVVHNERFGWLTSSIGFEQGLPSEKAFSILPVEGGFVTGTNRGIVTYVPSEIEPKMIPIRLISQRAHDLSELTGKIDLEYPQNALLVEVAGQSSRTFPEEFQYAFVLTNGKGEEVARQLSNDAQYSPENLGPDEYTIEAIAFNRDLLASEPLFIHFSVAKTPFPWTATALGVLLALALVGLGWAFFEHRRIRHRNRELAAARFDLANEAERERKRIARDLHDQTLADLRNLMLLTDRTPDRNPEFRAEIEAVSGEIRRICEDLSPSVLENVGLVASLEFLLQRTMPNCRFIADQDLEDRIEIPMNRQIQIYRIAQEVLSNIKNHSTADSVEMSVSRSLNGRLKVEIRDTGVKFDPDVVVTRGRGIANIRARASLINAEVAWTENDGGGNRFTLFLDS